MTRISLERKRLMEEQTDTTIEQNNVGSGWHCTTRCTGITCTGSNIPANAEDDLNFVSSNYDGGDINVQRLGSILRNVREAMWLMLSCCT